MLCGGISALIMAGYDILVEAGYAPEMAYFECLHETKLIVDLIYEGGIANMRYSVSNTAEYGDFTRGPRVIDESVRERMRGLLEPDPEPASSPASSSSMNRGGTPVMKAMRRRAAEHPVEEVGARLRSMMPWIRGEPAG